MSVYVYLLLKYAHVLLAIVAVGFNLSYFIWLNRAQRSPEHALYVLRGIKILDDRFANPAYALLLILGLAMTFTANIPLTTPWIAGALVLYVLLIIGGAGFYTPTLKRQIAALEAGNTASPAYAKLSQRGNFVGAILAIDVLVIVFLMVVKPTF
jgi:uncharacterized membrane protein